jgi:acyl-CoA synthetase (NDP forming)
VIVRRVGVPVTAATADDGPVTASGRPDIARMLEATSVAVVGASRKEGSVGRQSVVQLRGGGFPGPVYAVNPNYDEVEGVPCFPSLDAVPEPPDLAILAVANARLEQQLVRAAATGVRSAVVFASGEGTSPDGTEPLVARLTRIARDAGMVLCGGNCMGFINFEHGLRALGFEEREDLEPGAITWISHSGSAFSALLHNDRGMRFNLAVSSGQEFTTTMADYLLYALDRPSTRVAALFLETVRDPDRFRAALDLAWERDIPIVALKVGRSEAARPLIAAHSGALAGDDQAYDALFDAHGVIRVESLEELFETLELLGAGRQAAPGGLATLHDSGGERAHLIDVAATVGTPLAQISERTCDRLAAVLDPGLPAVNPLDAWGTGADYERVFLECLDALANDPDTGAVAMAVDFSGEDLEAGYASVAIEAARRTAKPFAVLCNLPTAIDRDAVSRLRRAGVPVLEGTWPGVLAFRGLFAHRDARALPAVLRPDPCPDDIRSRWRERLAASQPLSEIEGLSLLRDYGIPVPRFQPASGLSDACDAADEIGWPVALKTAAPDVTHKTEVRGVVVNIHDRDQLQGAYEDLSARLGPDVVVMQMAPRGVELALGMVHDPQFGPLVMVAAGGLLVELLGDRRFALPPVDDARARRLLDGLRVHRLLDGVRGSPAADVDAVAKAVVRLSELAMDLGDLIEAVDVNPLIAGSDACVAVDALVIPRRADA